MMEKKKKNPLKLLQNQPTNQPTRKEKLYYSTILKPFKIDAWHSLTQNFVRKRKHHAIACLVLVLVPPSLNSLSFSPSFDVSTNQCLTRKN